MIIGACGFGSTGSSAVTDYLLEFGNIQVLDQMEFTWVSGVDGLIDLDYHLNHPHIRTMDSIYAIQRFKEKVEKALRGYEKHGKIDSRVFATSAERFIEAITQVKWKWYIGTPNNIIERGIKSVAKKCIIRRELKTGQQVNWWPLKDVCFSVKPENFDEAARTHVRELIAGMGADFSKPIILDQPFAGNNPQACFKFFDNPYAIVVDRDPRDNYVFANTKLVGKLSHFMPIQPVENFVKYYRALRDNQPYKEENARVLSIKFEDMVYHYDETTKKIREFLDLPENPNPKSIFDPAISMPNTQVWKRFPKFAKDIEYIEAELKEYLFDYSGCPEPDINGKMFFGKSPNNRYSKNQLKKTSK